jgi:hypothetical protein
MRVSGRPPPASSIRCFNHGNETDKTERSIAPTMTSLLRDVKTERSTLSMRRVQSIKNRTRGQPGLRRASPGRRDLQTDRLGDAPKPGEVEKPWA